MKTPRRNAVVFVLLPAAIALALFIATLLPQEATHKGLTIHQWFSRSSVRSDPELDAALRILGTNNLPLLVRRLDYDPNKSRLAALCRHLPGRLQRQSWVADLASRKLALAEEAQAVLEMLGPGASPAIPQLTELARKGNSTACLRAVRVLSTIGEKASPAILSLVRTNTPASTFSALYIVAWSSDSPAVHLALANAQTNSEPQIRKLAKQAAPYE